MSEANRECPRFDRCAVNNCPLTTRYPDWFVSRDDAERRCTLGKKRRHEIGLRHGLPMEGLTLREWKGKQRWESLPPEEQQKRRSAAKNLAGPVCTEGHRESGSPSR